MQNGIIKFIIVTLVISGGVFGYSLYQKTVASAQSPLQSSTGAVQTSVNTANTISTGDDQINKLFLTTLLNLKKISLNDGVLKDPGFVALKDFTTEIKKTDSMSRQNPFALLGNDPITSTNSFQNNPVAIDGGTFGTTVNPPDQGILPPASSAPVTPPSTPTPATNIVTTEKIVTTGLPEKITASSAVLTGSISASAKITTRWFEYGNSTALGRHSINIPLSSQYTLSLSSLVSGRTYYYRACVQPQTGTPVCADTVNFTTL